MPVKSDQYSRVCVLSISGDLTAENVASLRAQVNTEIETKQIADFVVDLEKSGFIDSEGLEALLWLQNHSEELFGTTKLVGLDDNCRKIMEITRLEHQFEIHADLTGALRNMR